MREIAILILTVFIVVFFLAGGWYAMQYVQQVNNGQITTTTWMVADIAKIEMRVLAATAVACAILMLSLVIAHTKKLI